MLSDVATAFLNAARFYWRSLTGVPTVVATIKVNQQC